jgi:hypothetical protein
MMPVLRALLLTLLDVARSRASLQIELLALRHQLQVLQRTRPRRVALTVSDRWLWVWLSRVWRAWANRARHRGTRHRRRLASTGRAAVLDLEEPPTHGSPGRVARSPRPDSHHVGGQPAMGRVSMANSQLCCHL